MSTEKEITAATIKFWFIVTSITTNMTSHRILHKAAWMLLLCTSQASSSLSEQEDYSLYGLDVSLPIHGRVSTNYPDLPHNRDPEHVETPKVYKNMPIQPLGDRQQLYLDYLEGCRQKFAPMDSYKCDQFEYDRMIMNRRQPQSMMNLTKTGFAKIRAPPKLKKLIDEFWQANKNHQVEENWGEGNSYVNHWDQPSTLVSVDDTSLRGSGGNLKKNIWAATSALLEEWTQQELQPCSLYGIRVYHEGAIMMPHVDRLPLVASAAINIAQDTDEPWPTELYDHEGKAHNVTLEPGDMLLFESHSVVHGHPFPLKGRFYASLFIHFEPTGHSLGRNETGYFYVKDDEEMKAAQEAGRKVRGGRNSVKNTAKTQQNVDEQYREDTSQGFGGQSSSYGGLPPYIKRETPEEEHWLVYHPTGWQQPAKILPPEAHVAAKQGELEDLKQELIERKDVVLTERDENGWQVLHQGVAGGNEEVVKLLVSNGADVNARTYGGYGETPLRIAEKLWGFDNPISKYLKQLGALSIGPEL